MPCSTLNKGKEMLQPKDIALAAKAINWLPNLSPAARRVGLELLQRVDRHTGLTWPSQARLAAVLGLSTRTISSAIAQLQQAGFLTWKKARRVTNVYSLAVKALAAVAENMAAALRANPVQKAEQEPAASIKTGNKFPPIQSLVISSVPKQRSAGLWQKLNRLEPALLMAIIGTATEQDITTAEHLESLREGNGVQRLLMRVKEASYVA